MANLTIRNLPDTVRDALRMRAARHGRSMEAEAREVLTHAAQEQMSAAGRSALQQRLATVRGEFRRYVPEGIDVVDELIARHRNEARREEDDLLASPPPRSDD